MMDRWFSAVGASVVFVTGATCAGGVVHVNVAAPDGGDGESWETAFDDLGDGLLATDRGDEVWVAAGTYVPAGAFLMPTEVEVYGGFAGDEQTREERDWVANETILSGDRNGDDGPDFENYEDNVGPVVRVDGVRAGTTLDGFTISGGNAGDADGGGVYAVDSTMVVRNVVFRRNMAYAGGGMAAEFGLSLILESCTLLENLGGFKGGGLTTDDVDSVTATNCVFSDNFAEVAGGGAVCFGSLSTAFAGCVFRDNLAGPAGHGLGGGLLVAFTDDASLTSCVFAANGAGFDGGGIGLSATNATIVNCVASRNAAPTGAGMILSADSCTVTNSTFATNSGSGIRAESGTSLVIANSIIWGNTGPPIDGPGTVTASYSDIEGGRSGEGNIDADPRFVQRGTDNVRLGLGSPCVDAGNNDAVPVGIDVDVDGNQRIQNGVVDMGAYEGEHDGAPERAENDDIDDGETVLLVPNGGGFDPETNTLVVFTNRSGEDDANASVTEYAESQHPDARGFGTVGATAQLETSLDDGGFFAQVFVPFDEDDLDGADPLAIDMIYYDEGAGNWALAVSRNTAPSPGHRGAIGDRRARRGPGPWGVSLEVGDYGVYFDVVTRRGFTWANVDHASEFSIGLALCPADVSQPPDSSVEFDDLLAVLHNWGEGPGPFDINDDDTVDVEDLLLVLLNWGGCE